MDANVTTIIVAGIGASSGWLAFWRQTRKDKMTQDTTHAGDRRKAAENAVQGFADLVEVLERDIERREKDCDKRIARVERDGERRLRSTEHDLLKVIADLEGRLNGTG